MVIQQNGVTIVGNFKKTNIQQRLAIIGSRNTSQSEMDRAYWLGYSMVKRGYVVVSGLALGIDSASMYGAIQAIKDGYTGGVIGIAPCFYGEVYPKSEKSLYDLTQQYGYILYPYDCSILETDAYSKRCYHKTKKSYDIVPLLTDRSILNAEMCHEVHIVKDSDIITGGSRYAPSKAISLNRTVRRWDSEGKWDGMFRMNRTVSVNNPLYDYAKIKEIIDN